MGFFDFVKDVGENILGKGKDADDIKELINKEFGNNIQNLKVEFNDGIAKLYGVADSPEIREKAILLAGNIKGVKQVDSRELTYKGSELPASYFEEKTPEKPSEAPKAKEIPLESEFYTIKSGDTLSAIALKYYGDANKYPVIFEANRGVIKNANLIYPGQQIRIPKK